MRIRRVLTATMLAGLVTGGAMLTGGTASASTVLPNGCGGAVGGNIGDQIAVAGPSVKELVREGARKAWALAPWALADEIEKAGALPVGTVPDAPSGYVAGDAIGGVVANRLNGHWGVGLVNPQNVLTKIREEVARGCGGITVQVRNFRTAQAPAQGGASAGQPVPGGPAAGGIGGGYGATPLGGGTGDARAPMRDYNGIAAAVPGVSAPPPGMRYPNAGPIPGAQPPELGTLSDPAVRTAGNADALTTPRSASNVQLPMLLAVVALAGVTAALVRTWVLRKPS